MTEMTRKQFLKTLATGALALLGANAAGCGKPTPPAAKPENPYAYSLDAFRKVDPKRITFREDEPITLDAAPRCIALGSDDRLLVGTEKSLRIIPLAGGKAVSFPLSEAPHALAAPDQDTILIAFRSRIVRFTPAKKNFSDWSDLGESAFITGLDADSRHVLAADYGNKQLWLFNRQGTLLRFIGVKSGHRHPDGLKIPSPYFDAHFAKDGTLWAINPGMHRLEHYNLEGGKLGHWGAPGMNLEGFSGCCNPTHFTLLPNNRFATVEKGLVRIKVYSARGTLQDVVAPPDAFQEGLTGVSLAADRGGRIYAADRSKKQVRIFTKQ